MSLVSSPSPRAAEPNTAAYKGRGRHPASSSRNRLHSSFRSPLKTTAADAATCSRFRVAGEMLGVSGQLVDRMIKDGQLPATTEPNFAHQVVAVEDVRALAALREQAHSAVGDLIGSILSDGAEY